MANHYVDSAAEAGGDGTIETPWDTIADVNAHTFAADDFIYFKCGSTFNAQLTIGQSGTDGHPITYTSYSTGAKPIIDGQNTRNYCVYSSGKNYYTVDGLQLQNAINNGTEGGKDGGGVEMISGTGIVVQNCEIYHPKGRGMRLDTCSNCIIDNNLIDTTIATDSDRHEADGIYLSNGAGGHTISHNTILERRDSGAMYVDGIQTYNEGGFTIEYNFIANPTGYSSAEGNMLLQLEHGAGTFEIRYNIFFNDTNVEPSFILDGTIAQNPVYNVYNNVIINIANGGTYLSTAVNILSETPTDAFTFKNNIFYTYNGAAIRAIPGIASTSQLDYNCYYRASGTDLVVVSSTERTWAQMVAAGYEPHGYNADPKFANIGGAGLTPADYKILTDSPCKDKGVNLGLTEDYFGNLVGASPDIGAHEYTETAGATLSIYVGEE